MRPSPNCAHEEAGEGDAGAQPGPMPGPGNYVTSKGPLRVGAASPGQAWLASAWPHADAMAVVFVFGGLVAWPGLAGSGR